MSKITKKERIAKTLKRLDERYGKEIRVYLEHDNPWQLLIATILSAQCTDARVNMVTRELFKKYPDLQSFAEVSQEELENDIHSTGFYRAKASNIRKTARILVDEYNSEVPTEIEKLIKLPGVGRKTANVVRGNIYDIPSIVVDTHVKRVSFRLGFTKETDPVKVEYALMKILPEDHWISYNIQIIALGREICTARSPKCDKCFLSDICPKKC